MKKIYFISILILLSTFVAFHVYAQTTPASLLQLNILSSTELNGIAGDYVTVQAEVKNTSKETQNNIITYLSLSDNDTKLPVDLEDWSAEKGQFVGSIDSNQSFPLNWKLHFVKAGSYSLAVIAMIEGNPNPEISTITHFSVQAKKNLNPAHVLPVALGTPIVVIILLFVIASRRKVS